MINIRIFNDIDNINLKKDWNYLHNKLTSKSINSYLYSFINYEIAKIWLDAYHKSKTFVNIICIYIKDDPIIIIPLIKYKFLGFSIFKFIGGLELDYKNILFDGDEINNYEVLIYKKIRSFLGFNYIFIIDGINDKNTCKFFKKLFNYKFLIKKDLASFFIPSNDIVPKKLKKRIIKFKAKNKVIYKKIAKSDKNFDLVLKTLFFLKNQQYKRNKSSLMTLKREKFYWSLANSNIAHLSFTKIGNDFGAIHLGILTNNNFVYLLPAYNISYSKDSPGWIHIDYLLEECMSLRINKFDLTIGNEGYKNRISTKKTDIYSFIGSDIYSILNLLFVRFYYYLNDFPLFNDLKKIIKVLIQKLVI